MSMGSMIAERSMGHHKLVTVVMVVATLGVAAVAALPSIWPDVFPFLHPVEVDTDPENMLAHDEPVRVFHDAMKKELSLHDMVVVGIVNEHHEHGVFNPASLERIYELTEFAKTLTWEGEDGETIGVVEVDLIAPSTVDNIEQGGLGTVKFEWLMPEPPETAEEAVAIREKARNIPFLNGTLVSEDGQAICIYLPLTHKDLSYRVYSALNEKIATFDGDDEFYITGLPVAEDTFGVEMFIQMGISAPMAMLVIFLLMLFFFRKLVLIVSPMIVAMVSVILTMGALIGAGFPVHIMSSMIPIFIMPIAVLDSVHFISEFFDRYQKTRDRKQTVKDVTDELFMPMLYTSLTSSAGFASLALTPIPPVQVFGVFVAMGIMAAWLLTIVFIPAYVMFISPATLETFGAVPHDAESGETPKHGLPRVLHMLGGGTFRWAKPIIALAGVVIVISAYGISLIEINDNPVKWFTKSHPIRVADRVLNEHFGGTYMAYLALRAPEEKFEPQAFAEAFAEQASGRAKELEADFSQAPQVFGELVEIARAQASKVKARDAVYAALKSEVDQKFDAAEGDLAMVWDEASLFLDEQRQANEVFKDPQVVGYLADLQQAMLETGVVGKSNSLADLVKTVHRELLLGKPEEFRIPDTRQAVAQCLITYQNSHRADDLWHFVTPSYRKSSIWVQLNSGDNKDMTQVVKEVDAYMAENPPPANLEPEWFGLTYINVIWQDKMVSGMLQAFLGSFLVVFLLMTILFRSSLWGLLSMVPLTLTIVAIYGAIGLVGKAYDMPVAVLSSLALGLAVDFAIHFLARSRRMYERFGSWQATAPAVFGEPARAIVRNIIVIATGFLPLLFAPLMPYKTVGVLLATILLVSGIATLLLLPALMRLLESRLFVTRQPRGVTCQCVTCMASSVAAVLLIALNLHQYGHIGWNALTWLSVILIPLLAFGCGLLSRRNACRVEPTPS